MILLDTHIWAWWVAEDPRLTDSQRQSIHESQSGGLGVSVISCWEVAKLVQNSRLKLDRPVDLWVSQALGYPGVRLLELTPRIAVESTHLPGEFHKDPADQILVATSRIHDCPILTTDARILNYPHVKTLW